MLGSIVDSIARCPDPRLLPINKSILRMIPRGIPVQHVDQFGFERGEIALGNHFVGHLAVIEHILEANGLWVVTKEVVETARENLVIVLN